MLNEGFRYRDLETGTWLSRDPAGFVDGPNLYAYVKCNPWSAFDPEGLFLEYLIDKLDTHVSQPIADAIGDRISGETCAALAGNKAFGVLQGAAEAAHTGSKAALGTLVPGSGTLHAGEAVLSGEGSFADLGKAVVQDIGGKKLNQALSAGEALTAAASGDLQGAVSSAAGVLGGKGKGKGGSGKPVTQTTGQQGDVAANTERVRHYTNRKGSKGIESDGVIKAQDNNRVYVEPANRKPLPQAKAESKYQLKEGRGRDYIETDVDASRVEWVKNPRYGTKEMTVKGDLELHNSEVTRRK